MGHLAVEAAVGGGDGDGDHLALQLGEAAVGQHQVVVERGEGVELVDVEGIGLEHVGHEAELLLADAEILRRRLRQRVGHGQVERGRGLLGQGGSPSGACMR